MESLDFELNVNADTHNLPDAAKRLADVENGLKRAGAAAERFDKTWRDTQGRLRDERGRFVGVGSGLSGLAREMDAAGRAYETSVGRIARSSSASTSRILELAGALSIARSAIGAVGKLAGLVSSGGAYASQAMGERSATIRAYTQLTGSKEQANLELYRAQSYAQKTDFTSEAIEKSQARLMAQGFRGQELYSTLFAASDLAAIMPGNKNETLERVTMAMSQIRAKGKLQGEELTQQLAEAGLNTALVKQQLMKSLGLKSTGEVDKLMGKGQISADVALPAIQRAILQQLGTSRAGEFATSSAGSVTALESNRAEAIKNVLKGFDADENLPAMERYKKALTDQGRLFNINSKTGKDLSLVVQDLANASLEAKSAVNEFVSGFVESFSDSYAKTLAKEGRNDIGSSIDQLDMLGRAIGRLGSVASMAVGRTDGLVGSLAGLLTDQIDAISATQQVSGGMYIKSLLRGTLPGMAASGIQSLEQSAYNRITGKGGEGVDVQAEVRRKLRESESERAAFGEFTGAGMGGGKAPESPFAIKIKEQTRNKAKTDAKAAKEEYRGVFWGYQFGDVGEGKFASQLPTAGEQAVAELFGSGMKSQVRGMWHSKGMGSLATLTAGTHVTQNAITELGRSIAGTPQQVVINISGYGKDKLELARAIATELGRTARQPS